MSKLKSSKNQRTINVAYTTARNRLDCDKNQEESDINNEIENSAILSKEKEFKSL